VRLPDPVDPPHPLLDPHRVPGEVVVDHHVAELEVATLAGRLGAQQHRLVAREARDRGVLLSPGEAAVVRRGVDAVVGDDLRQPVQRAARRGEHDHLLVPAEVTAEQDDQRVRLGGRGHGAGACREIRQLEPIERVRARPRARARLMLEAAEREAPRCACSTRPLAHVSSDLAVQRGLLGERGDAQRLGEAARQHHGQLAAAVADHQLAQGELKRGHVAHP
jgi:hypothetical protein